MSRAKGSQAESSAADFLEKKGFSILERNYRLPFGEIDLVAREGDTVVFVEVKARSGSGFGGPEASVGSVKQRKLVRTAQAWLRSRRWEGPARFDVVAIEGSDIRHIEDAFDARP
ncbi:MAG: YraN family protein [Elusimicrobia bacterium]|nr:YraN family protein [Elusimicrobiota bacterium]